jgi:hypothetical protein
VADPRRSRGTKATKSNAARRVPIEPALLPLLRVLFKKAKGKGSIVRCRRWGHFPIGSSSTFNAPGSLGPISSPATRPARPSPSTTSARAASLGARRRPPQDHAAGRTRRLRDGEDLSA